VVENGNNGDNGNNGNNKASCPQPAGPPDRRMPLKIGRQQLLTRHPHGKVGRAEQ
jgi:hypothetical protein